MYACHLHVSIDQVISVEENIMINSFPSSRTSLNNLLQENYWSVISSLSKIFLCSLFFMLIKCSFIIVDILYLLYWEIILNDMCVFNKLANISLSEVRKSHWNYRRNKFRGIHNVRIPSSIFYLCLQHFCILPTSLCVTAFF